MRWTLSLSRTLAAFAAVLFAASVGVVLFAESKPRTNATPSAGKQNPAQVPLFSATEPAKNASVMFLQPDENGVTGWIAGKKSYAGQNVEVSSSFVIDSIPVNKDNTFRWNHKTPSPHTVWFTHGPLVGKPRLDQLAARTKLVSAPVAGGPSIFFVTDRSAYRPGHTLKFAAFVRKFSAVGEFEPIRDEEVMVDLTSNTRGTRATRMKLRSDSFGRVVGQYTFSEADALDHYTLSADKYTGSVSVLLAEYRKSKVSLKITGELKEGRLMLTFDARDYLDRAVKGLKATYTAAVTRSTEPEKLTLDPAAFANPASTPPPAADDLDSLPNDERLLALANGVTMMTFAGFGTRSVAQANGTVEFGSNGPGTVTLPLSADWLRGKHTVTVTGVMLNDTGRENRASKVISLEPKATRGVTLTAAREMIAAGETVSVALEPFGLVEKDRAATTLVVARLSENPSLPVVDPSFSDGEEPDGILSDNVRLPALASNRVGKPVPPAEGWKISPVFNPVRSSMVTVLPVVDGKADVELKRPGAYKLLAVTRLADGTVLQSETGVIAKAPAKLPGVVLKLEAREIEGGTRLRGVAHTRFAGAKMLLALRDSTGIRLTKVLTANEQGVEAFDEPLPPNLRYGCAVAVAYPESDAIVHSDQRELFVIPSDRTIAVTAKAPETVGPGADVTLDVNVNRKEEVDLVVSVYDESLLGISGDLSKNIRDFYLADVHGLNRAGREFARTRLGNVAIADLIEKAEELLKKPDSLGREPGLQQRLKHLVQSWKTKTFYFADAATLVRLAGHQVYLGPEIYGGRNGEASHFGPVSVSDTSRLSDLFASDSQSTDHALKLSAAVIGNSVVLTGWFGPPAKTGYDFWAGFRQGSLGRAYGFGGIGGIQGGISGFGGIQGWPNYGIQGFAGGIAGGFGGGGFGFGGGIGGFGGIGSIGGGIAGTGFPGGNGFYSAPGAGIQGGFSLGFNRDFSAGLPNNSGPGGPMPGLGLTDDVIRRDFADSAFWSANVRTDPNGKAAVTFKIPDSLVSWRVAVTAVSGKMHVGTGTAKFRSTRPIMVWPMLPRTFTEGDEVQLFGMVNNLTEKEQTIQAHLKAKNGEVLDAAMKTVIVPANGNVPVYWTYRAGKAGMTDLLMSVKCEAGSDASLKRLPVSAAGVMERLTASGLVGNGNLMVSLPSGFDTSSAKVQVTVAPSLVADMADTLPYLVEYPYGCVEQTMSRFLPAVRVSQILQQSGLHPMPELEKKLPKVVEAGVKRLLELQQADGGWGWQGTSQTHEMMTPYALFGLIEAEKAGYAIPNGDAIPRGLERLHAFLDHLKPQWARDAKSVFGSRGINDSLYCLSILSQKKAVPSEWWLLISRKVGGEQMSDYGHALALEMAVRSGEKKLADSLAAELRKRAQKSDDLVFWTTAAFSRWADNTIEVTAGVLRALVAYDPHDPLIPGILAYFQTTKRGDRWDSTKDTACVLFALCDYLHAAKGGPTANGSVAFTLNGGEESQVKLDGAASRRANLQSADLKAGANTVAIHGDEGTKGALVRLVVSFQREKGNVPARDHGVRVARTLLLREKDGSWRPLKSGTVVPKASFIKVRVEFEAMDRNPLQYTLLESPKPACGETIPADDKRFPADSENAHYVLREDREAMTCFHYENVNVRAVADYVFLTEFAGEFRLPPARVERMYQPTSGGHSDSFVLKVGP